MPPQRCLQIQWEPGQGKEHLPGESGQQHGTGSHWADAYPWPGTCHVDRQAKGTRGVQTPKPSETSRKQVDFLEVKGSGDSSKERLQLQDHLESFDHSSFFFCFETDWVLVWLRAIQAKCWGCTREQPCSRGAYILLKRQRINNSNAGFRILYRETGYWK